MKVSSQEIFAFGNRLYETDGERGGFIYAHVSEHRSGGMGSVYVRIGSVNVGSKHATSCKRFAEAADFQLSLFGDVSSSREVDDERFGMGLTAL